MPINPVDFTLDDELSLSREEYVEKGKNDIDSDGNSVIPILGKKNRDFLKRLLLISGENNTSRDTPKGVVGDKGWDNRGDKKYQSNRITGVVLASENISSGGSGGPLAGTVRLYESGEKVYQESTDGIVDVSAPTPAGVILGDSVIESEDSYVNAGVNFAYRPANNGLPLEIDDISNNEDFGTVTYSEISGSIELWNGDAVEGDTVNIEGFRYPTNSQGIFKILGPTGKEITVKALDDSVEDNVVFEGSGQEFGYAYARIVVKILDENFESVSNAPVQVNGSVYSTDRTGTVVVDKVPIEEATVKAMENFEAIVNVSETGTKYTTVLSPNSLDFLDPGQELRSLSVNAIDNKTGDSIKNLSVTEILSGSQAETGENGSASLLTLAENDEIRLVIGREDERFENTFVSGSVEELATELTVEVPRSIAVGNR